MNDTRIDQIINILYAATAISVLPGAFFRLQHYPYGNYLLLGGFILGTILGISKLIITKS
ncbi:hypothetical protein AQPE_1908 [Aquipluma nitroreducens]|uniref:Uncharacterized protein n=1 Tax=Aquipluma nitroreducens TaxID=2010828 RepID=A0A5K7S859_9BACT|nr:hypothetical protein [Aquipluma nitroreducens]BBE17751.1 hypothetical protein AQPE_1908 [Aquipluma nitroreducens]